MVCFTWQFVKAAVPKETEQHLQTVYTIPMLLIVKAPVTEPRAIPELNPAITGPDATLQHEGAFSDATLINLACKAGTAPKINIPRSATRMPIMTAEPEKTHIPRAIIMMPPTIRMLARFTPSESVILPPKMLPIAANTPYTSMKMPTLAAATLCQLSALVQYTCRP